MVFETTGGVNNEGLELLRQLFRFAAKHQSLRNDTVMRPRNQVAVAIVYRF